MLKKKILLPLLIGIFSSIIFVGCSNDKQENNTTIIGQEDPIIQTPTPELEDLQYKPNEVINISGTNLIMYDSYETNFYNTTIDFVDIDFIDYNIGVSLPSILFDPNNLYYLEEDEDGGVLIHTNDANKTILNFMDDYHYTLFNYSCGVFSTWSYTIDKETYDNLMYCLPGDVVTLLENEEEISYKNGYNFEKHFDNKDENAYRILMEIDYYPFTTESSSLFYHGYMVLLVHNKDVRAVVFAEPKFDETMPYQMGYPIVKSCYWLDVPVLNYGENNDLESFIQTTPTMEPKEEEEIIEETDENELPNTSIPTIIEDDDILNNETQSNVYEDQSFSSIPLEEENQTPTPTTSLSGVLLPK